MASERVLRAEFRQTLAHVLAATPGRGRLLEFGCAYGFFLQEAAQEFHEVQGIELAADAVTFAQRRGLDVRCGVVDHATVSGLYDAVVGLDVIEHVPDPHETLRLLADHLTPEGALVLTTGNWSSVYARLSGRRWRLMTPPQHLSFFTPTAIRALCERVGLTVTEVSHPWKRVPLSLMAYQLQRVAGLKPRKLTIPGGVSVNLFDAMRVTARKC